ncbi:whey acidic protein-like [Boleophthalmus pectinirostris]|uniref:whey acidic protein-like n=1 Tax=Boleophthalmus pectinirostris TaxID=150288 RepID=UPI00242BF78C|nr:whey acidic protein-like [Boleophthalmus pectinirostris]
MKCSVLCLLTVAFVPLLSALKDKDGRCPVSVMNTDAKIGLCLEQCSTDRDCDRNLKCCYTGCGHLCQEPLRGTKPGSCPAPINHLTTCDDQCSNDSECDKNLKCCYSGCGYECKSPEHGNQENMRG